MHEGRGWKGHHMMNFSSLSPKSLLRIMRGSVTFSQMPYHLQGGGWAYRVTYPNGYGASIIYVPDWGIDKGWEVGLLKDGELWSDDAGYDCTWSDLTEEGVIDICNHIYFY